MKQVKFFFGLTGDEDGLATKINEWLSANSFDIEGVEIVHRLDGSEIVVMITYKISGNHGLKKT